MIFDLVILVLFALAALNGWRSGALAMLLSIAVLAAAFIFGSQFASQAGEMLRIGPGWMRPVIGFILVFAIVIILGGWLKRFVRPKRGLLRGLDGLAGAVLGFLRAIAVLALVLGLLKIVRFPPERWTADSRLYPALLHVSTWITGHATEAVSKQESRWA